MLATVRSDKGLGNATVFASARNGSGQFWDWTGNAWVATETSATKQYLTESADRSAVTSRYVATIATVPTGEFVLEYVGADGETIGAGVATESDARLGVGIAGNTAAIATNTTAIAAIPTNPLRTNDSRLNNLDAAVSSLATAAAVAALPQDKANYSLSPAGITGVWSFNILGLPVSTYIHQMMTGRAADRATPMNAMHISPIDSTHSVLSGYTFDSTPNGYVGCWMIVNFGAGLNQTTGVGSLCVITASNGANVTHTPFTGSPTLDGTTKLGMFQMFPSALDLATLVPPPVEVWSSDQRDEVLAAVSFGLGTGTVNVSIRDIADAPVAGVRLYLRNVGTDGALVGQALTDDSGDVALAHDGGHFEIHCMRAGFTIPTQDTGALGIGDVFSATLLASAVSISPAADPSECTLYATLRQADGTPDAGVTGTLQVERQKIGENWFSAVSIAATSDSTGLISWTVPRTARVVVAIPQHYPLRAVKVPDAASSPLP